MNIVYRQIYVILWLGVFLFGCKGTIDEKKLFKNNTIFNTFETEMLLDFLHAFDTELAEIEGIKKKEIKNLYESFFKRMKSQINDRRIAVGFDKATQDRIESKLDEKLKRELWANMYKIINTNQTVPDTIKQPVLNIKGRFFTFLKTELAPSNEVIKKQIERVEAVGDMTPAFFTDIALFPDKYDILDDRIRLMIVIHYVGLSRGYLNTIINE